VLEPTESIDLGKHTTGILHVKLTVRDGATWAIVSGGFGAVAGAVLSVNLATKETKVVATAVRKPEGVSIVETADGTRAFAYIGGVSSNTLMAVLDITDPASMTLVREEDVARWTHLGGLQLVPARKMLTSNGKPVLAVSVWGVEGGVMTLDVSDPAEPKRLKTETSIGMSFANRLVVSGGIGYLPLEQPMRGGIGFVDLSDPSDPRALGTWFPALLPGATTYTLAVVGDLLYFFQYETSAMLVYRLG